MNKARLGLYLKMMYFCRREVDSHCAKAGGHSHPSFELGQLDSDDSPTPEESVEEMRVCKWTDGEYLELQACSLSCCGVDPFTSSVALIDLRMHSYIQYYLDNVLPVPHPFEEQMALLKDSLLG